MDSIQTALMLLAIGLPTVFLVLLLVIGVSKLLILGVNKYAPELSQKVIIPTSKNDISNAKVSAITAAVSVLTHGQGHIQKIEKKI